MKDVCYEDVTEIYNSTPINMFRIVIGEFNVLTVGLHSMHEQSNCNRHLIFNQNIIIITITKPGRKPKNHYLLKI